MVEDSIPGGGINRAGSHSEPAQLTNIGGTLYFFATESDFTGRELWRINALGIAEIVEDAVPGGGITPGTGSSDVRNLTNVNGTLYFSCSDGTNGTELWRVNPGGVAVMVEDSVPGGGIRPGSASSIQGYSYFTNVGGTLYFNANDGTNGVELWRINSAGTAEIVEDAIPGGGIAPGSATSTPRSLANINGQLYFSANDGTNGVRIVANQ